MYSQWPCYVLLQLESSVLKLKSSAGNTHRAPRVAHRRGFCWSHARAPLGAQTAAPFVYEEGLSSCTNCVRFVCALIARAGWQQNLQRLARLTRPQEEVSRPRPHNATTTGSSSRCVAGNAARLQVAQLAVSIDLLRLPLQVDRGDQESQQAILRGPTSSSR